MAIPPINQPLASDRAKLRQAANKWLTGRILFLQKNQTIPGAMKASNYQNRNLFSTGEVFMYTYDPKWKVELPYYDTFPLVIPIEYYSDGFLGLNLHYLPPVMRASFLNELIKLVNSPPGDKRLRMDISYSILKNSKNLNYYIPCVKRYLINHVRGKILRIQPHEWPLAIILPVANFQKATHQQVWQESRNKINGR